MAEPTGSNVTVRPSPTAVAEVNRPPKVTMYLDGVPIDVDEKDVPQMQARGALIWGKEDLVRLPEEIDQLLDQVRLSLHRFVDGVSSDGYIDTSDASESRALQQGMVRLTQRMNDVLTVAGLNYPVREEPENAEARLTRLAMDARHHDWGARELQQRYGLDRETAEQVMSREEGLDFTPATGDEWVQYLQDDNTLSAFVPRSELPADKKDAVVSVRTTPPVTGGEG